MSALSRTERRRVAPRTSPHQLPACDDLLASCFEVTITPASLTRRASSSLRRCSSLDALHLVCAQKLGQELSALVAYDERLLAAGEATGLAVAHPS